MLPPQWHARPPRALIAARVGRGVQALGLPGREAPSEAISGSLCLASFPGITDLASLLPQLLEIRLWGPLDLCGYFLAARGPAPPGDEKKLCRDSGLDGQPEQRAQRGLQRAVPGEARGAPFFPAPQCWKHVLPKSSFQEATRASYWPQATEVEISENSSSGVGIWGILGE